MTSKVKGLEKLEKLMERLSFKLSLIVLHSLINNYKERKKYKPWKTKKCTYEMIYVHMEHKNNI